jgi:hypothetical protein
LIVTVISWVILRAFLGARGGFGGRCFRPRAHGEPKLVIAGFRSREDDERQISLAELRKRKLYSDAALVVACSRVLAVSQSALDRGLDLGARLRLAIGPAQDFQIERDIPRREPRARVEKLHLNPARVVCLPDGGSDFGPERAGAKVFDHDAMLVLDALAQRIRAEFRRGGE